MQLAISHSARFPCRTHAEKLFEIFRVQERLPGLRKPPSTLNIPVSDQEGRVLWRDTNLIQHRPTFLKCGLVQHAFHTRTQAVDLNELNHQPIGRVEFGQLFWRSFTIDIKFPDLIVMVRRGELVKTEYRLVPEWEGSV